MSVPPRAKPELGPHSPRTDKSYRKRGDLSLGLAWLVSGWQGEQQRTTQQVGATAAPGSEGHLIGPWRLLGYAGEGSDPLGRLRATSASSPL